MTTLLKITRHADEGWNLFVLRWRKLSLSAAKAAEVLGCTIDDLYELEDGHASCDWAAAERRLREFAKKGVER